MTNGVMKDSAHRFKIQLGTPSGPGRKDIFFRFYQNVTVTKCCNRYY